MSYIYIYMIVHTIFPNHRLFQEFLIYEPLVVTQTLSNRHYANFNFTGRETEVLSTFEGETKGVSDRSRILN